jgi:hypothetical protein
MPASPIKIMVSSSVYHFEDQLDQIAAILTGYGYEVVMSHFGTVRVGLHQHNFAACRQAVERSDLFLGIIRGQYGSGRGAAHGLGDEEISITHAELRHAIQHDKPRLFFVEAGVDTARQLLRPLRSYLTSDLFDENQQIVWTAAQNSYKHNPVLDDLRVLDMYDEALQSSTPLSQRRDHWCQLYRSLTDIQRFLETQFRDQRQLRADLNTALAAPGEAPPESGPIP